MLALGHLQVLLRGDQKGGRRKVLVEVDTTVVGAEVEVEVEGGAEVGAMTGEEEEDMEVGMAG